MLARKMAEAERGMSPEADGRGEGRRRVAPEDGLEYPKTPKTPTSGLKRTTSPVPMRSTGPRAD